MNAAVAKRARSTRWGIWAVVLIVGLGLCSAGIKAFNRGPLYCNSCWLGLPDIDQGTKDFLESQLAIVDEYVPLWMNLTNTTYTICNATHCATYFQTFDGKYMSNKKVPRDQPPEGSDSGGAWSGGTVGGGGYGGGGGAGGGGSWGSGTVTVGQPGPVKPPEVPTSDF